MSAKHTPGPMESVESYEGCPFPSGVAVAVVKEGARGRADAICSIVGQGNALKYDPAVTSANARLLAAAYTSYDKHCGPRAVECAEEDLLGQALDALRSLLQYAESQTCPHEETHRGGIIWTICNACGRKWADDRGGFEPYETPSEFEDAHAILTKAGAK